MSVWFTIPSKRPPAESSLGLWRRQGYKIALQTDPGDRREMDGSIDAGLELCIETPYCGYAVAVNRLVAEVMIKDPAAEWFVAAGDDMEPDLGHTAEEIAEECGDHFRNLHIEATGETIIVHPTMGVMQPTGDRWGEHAQAHEFERENAASVRCGRCHRKREHNIHLAGAYSDRVCGSAWIGREFAQRVNQGRGPLWPEYFHMGVDEELQAVATRLGVLWQRRDLIQLHKHWGRAPAGQMGSTINMPAFLERANSVAEWAAYKKLYTARAEAGFPGSEVIG